MEAEVAEFLAARGKAACAPLIANAFRAAEYPEAEWVEALIQMSPETLAELIAAVEAEAAAAGVAASPSHEPEPEPEQLPAAPPPPLQQQPPQQQQPLLLGFDGAAATMAAAPAALPDPFGLGVPTSQTSVPPIPLEGVDLLGMAPSPAAQPPSIDLLGGGAPPPISGGGGGGYLSASDTEGGASSIALPQGSAALPEPVFTLVCFPSELVGEKPRRVYVKALGGTFEGLKTSLQQRLELEDAEFTITLDGAEPGHFVQHLADFDAEAGSYAVHIERTVEAEAALQIRHVNEVINGQIKADMRNFLRSGFGCAWNPAMIDGHERDRARRAALLERQDDGGGGAGGVDEDLRLGARHGRRDRSGDGGAGARAGRRAEGPVERGAGGGAAAGGAPHDVPGPAAQPGGAGLVPLLAALAAAAAGSAATAAAARERER
jgi:hypothetical protein